MLIRFDFQKKWWPRTELRRQPPDSESGALLVELRGALKMAECQKKEERTTAEGVDCRANFEKYLNQVAPVWRKGQAGMG
jgi:hypothetical protein